MELDKQENEPALKQASMDDTIRKAIADYMGSISGNSDPDWRAKAGEERRRRQDLERRFAELREENRRTRQQAEQAERLSAVRSELLGLGVQKVDLALRLVKDDVFRGEDGDLYADADGAQVPYRDYLKKFVSDNPEFLPPRISGGSGAVGSSSNEFSAAGFDLERIRPGMSREESAQAWKEVARLAGMPSKSW